MVNAMRMIDFTECCHQGEYLQDIDRHSRDFENLKQCLKGVSNGYFLTSIEGSIVTPFMKVGLLFIYRISKAR
jgi:hypothetical protein